MHRDYSRDYKYLFDPSYFQVTFYTYNQKLKSIGRNRVKTSINQTPLVRCEDRFVPSVKQFSTVLGLKLFLCPEHNNYTIGGNFISKDYSDWD